MPVKVRHLKAQCESLAEDLLLHEQASVEALRALRPGGAENPKRDSAAWVWYYGQLQLLRGRAQGPDGKGAPVPVGASREDSLVLASLAAKPEVVRRSDRDFAVYPKSLAALLHCHARDLIVARLARVTADVMDRDGGKLYADLTHQALTELGLQTRALCWIACTKGPGLPFEEYARDISLPDEWRDLDPITVVEINRAFARVNYLNLKALEALITPDPEGERGGRDRARPSWSTFVGSLAMELHEDPMALMRDRSLASILASTQLSASAQREAMAEAKRKADEERRA